MRKFWLSMVALLASGLLFLGSSQANAQTTLPTAQPTDPESIYRAEYEAQNASDIDKAVDLYAEGAVSIAFPPPPGTTGVFIGKDEIRKINEDLAERHFHTDFTDFHVNGNSVKFTLLVVEDFFREVGVSPIKLNGVAIIQDGLIQAETLIMDKDSQIRLEAALLLQTNKAAVQRAYTELWSQGNLAIADELNDSQVVDHRTDESGSAGLKQSVTRLREAFPDLSVTINHLMAESDLVVADVTLDYGVYMGERENVFSLPDSDIGKRVEGHAVEFYRFSQGRIVEVWGVSEGANWYKQLR